MSRDDLKKYPLGALPGDDVNDVDHVLDELRTSFIGARSPLAPPEGYEARSRVIPTTTLRSIEAARFRRLGAASGIALDGRATVINDAISQFEDLVVPIPTAPEPELPQQEPTEEARARMTQAFGRGRTPTEQLPPRGPRVDPFTQPEPRGPRVDPFTQLPEPSDSGPQAGGFARIVAAVASQIGEVAGGALDLVTQPISFSLGPGQRRVPTGQSLASAGEAGVRLADTPRNTLFAFLEGEDPIDSMRNIAEALQFNELFLGRDVGGVRLLSDEDIIGSLSLRDIIGGATDLALDPIGGPQLLRAGGRKIVGLVKQYGDEAVERALIQADPRLAQLGVGAGEDLIPQRNIIGADPLRPTPQSAQVGELTRPSRPPGSGLLDPASEARAQQMVTRVANAARPEPYFLTHEEAVRKTSGELDDAHSAAVEVFGEEGAARYEALQRTVNSRDTRAADEAARLAEDMEATLSPEQERRLFGVFDPNEPDAETLQQFVRATEPLDGMDDAFVIGQLQRNLHNVDPERLARFQDGTGTLSVSEQLAAVHVREAIDEGRRRGLDPDVMLQQAARGLANDVGAEDAEFLLSRWKGVLSGEAPSAQRTPVLGPPEELSAGVISLDDVRRELADVRDAIDAAQSTSRGPRDVLSIEARENLKGLLQDERRLVREVAELEPTPPVVLPDAPSVETIPRSVDAPLVDPVTPTEAQAVIGLRPIESGLTRLQELTNSFKGAVGIGVPADEFSTPAFAERARVRPIIESEAAITADVSNSIVREAFKSDIDDAGRLQFLAGIDPDVPGAPTIRDVAARLPRYLDSLSPAQQQAMEDLRAAVAPYADLIDEFGVKVGTRDDIVEGGFYLPRGNAAEQGVDAPLKIRAPRGGDGKASFQSATRFSSEAEGIEAGWEYTQLRDSVRTYANDAGQKSADRHVESFLKGAIDPETGAPLGEGAAARVLRLNPELVVRINILRNGIGGRRLTLRNQGARLSAQEQAALDLERSSEAATARALGAEERLEDVASRRPDRTIISTEDDMLIVSPNVPADEVLSAAERELSVLRQAEARAARDAASGGERAAATTARRDDTLRRMNDLQIELDSIRGEWAAALERAAKTPADRGTIGLAGLQGTAFPDSVANAANKVLQEEAQLAGRGSAPIRLANALNNLYRGFRATGDNSAIGIQGLLGLADDQSAYARALRVNFSAWGNDGEQVLGAFLRDFNKKVAENGRASASVWAQNRLRVGGSATEFELKGIVTRLPGVQRANRAFGFFGDALRLSWADDLLEAEIRKGRTLQEIIDSGDMEGIAKAVNGATGWAEGKAFGSYGDLMLFAPRFLQSRMETVARAAMGLRPGATIEQKVARRAMTRMIGYGTLLTIAANELAGEETDFRLFVNGRLNPNFMRVRAFGRDWSMFGTWDSLVRAIILTAQGKPQDALRNMGSGVVANAWDLITGENAIGQQIPNRPREIMDDPGAFAARLAQNFVPFAAEEIPAAIGQIGRGDIFGGAATLTGEMLGIKSSPLTQFERDLEEDEKAFEAMPEELRDGAESLKELENEVGSNVAEARIDAFKTAEKVELEQRRLEDLRERAADGDRTALALLISVEERDDLVTLVQEVTREDGSIDHRAYRTGRSRIKNDARVARAEYADVFDGFAESDSRIDRLSSDWYDLFGQAENESGAVDYDRFEELEAQWAATLDPGDFETVMANVNAVDPRDTPLEKQLQLVRISFEGTGFFDLRDEAWAAYSSGSPLLRGKTEAEWRESEFIEWRKALLVGGSPGETVNDEAMKKVSDSDTIQLFNDVYADEFRTPWVNAHPGLASLAILWGYFKPDPRQENRDFIDVVLREEPDTPKQELAEATGSDEPAPAPAPQTKRAAPPPNDLTAQVLRLQQEGKSQGQIAIETGLTRNAVKLRLRRARRSAESA